MVASLIGFVGAIGSLAFSLYFLTLFGHYGSKEIESNVSSTVMSENMKCEKLFISFEKRLTIFC